MIAKITARHRRVAKLLAEDRLSKEEIAATSKMSPTTLYEWMKEPLFQSVVREYAADIEAAISRIPYAKKADRIQLLSDNVSKYVELQEMRGKWYTERFPEVPGGGTGLLVHSETVKGVGQYSVHIDEHKVDTGLQSLMNASLMQIAKERGELSETKPTHTVVALVPITEIEVALPSGPPADRDED